MVNLKELEEKLDLALTNETEETLTAWIEYKRKTRLLNKTVDNHVSFVQWLEDVGYIDNLQNLWLHYNKEQ